MTHDAKAIILQPDGLAPLWLNKAGTGRGMILKVNVLYTFPLHTQQGDHHKAVLYPATNDHPLPPPPPHTQ